MERFAHIIDIYVKKPKSRWLSNLLVMPAKLEINVFFTPIL